ncbi:methyltransferase domain-containing protein [Bifidobacterium sp. 82T24]|uniref:class I SAM-dependent methyltransferase n=1 Tax=Bifidobacterium pluvialisilvae TaxID=2834436 RepID=UPI001C57F3A9|nr:class I SAM-dependent methyltransferase [Bifidobacterium pluvialisilvae]MBW3088211.1 methyltransferase domain-containing protein [Bifidobacterium pluvialisilvae]
MVAIDARGMRLGVIGMRNNFDRAGRMIVDKRIDHGTAFDWGRVSDDYARYRNIYPSEFYRRILDRGLCRDGQTVLDLGTGTGVLPRALARYGASWIGIDISENQIAQARRLSEGLNVEYRVMPAERIDFPDGTFDVITACQCFWYFDHEAIHNKLHRMLADGGRILVLYMAWLPFEDRIAGASERLILKYNPNWSGEGERMRPISIPDCYRDGFKIVHHEEYTLEVPFTRESWNGRVKACRGIGASLHEGEVSSWEREHMRLLERIAPERFKVLHYAAMAELKRI